MFDLSFQHGLIDGIFAEANGGGFTTYGVEGRWDKPSCHYLRGYFAGFFRSLFWSDEIECAETTCRGKGDDACEFLIANSRTPDADRR